MSLTPIAIASELDIGINKRANRIRDILLGILPLICCLELFAWGSFLPGALRGHADFRQLYIAGYLVRTGQGHRLYDYTAQNAVQRSLISANDAPLPFIRPAYQALIFAPFSLLSFRAAYLTFLGVNAIILGFCFWLVRPRIDRLAQAWTGLPPILFLTFYPVALALQQGQDSVLLLAILCSALVSLETGRELLAGVLVGLGLFKFQIVIPIAVLFLGWRRWRFCSGFAVSAGLVSALSLVLVGWRQTAAFVRVLFSVGAGIGSPQFPAFPLRVTLMANLRGLVTGAADGRIPPIWIQVSILVLSVFMIAWLIARIPHTLPSRELLPLTITASILLSYYLFIHDLSVALIPILLTLDRLITAEDRCGYYGALLAALFFVAPLFLFVVPGHFYLLTLLVGALLWVEVRMVSSGKDLFQT